NGIAGDGPAVVEDKSFRQLEADGPFVAPDFELGHVHAVHDGYGSGEVERSLFYQLPRELRAGLAKGGGNVLLGRASPLTNHGDSRGQSVFFGRRRDGWRLRLACFGGDAGLFR